MIRYFVNSQGDYLGGFDGAQPPNGSIEVPTPPAHGMDKWADGAWVNEDHSPTHDEIYDQIMQNSQLLRAVVKAINKGDLVTGANKTGAELKAIIKAEMNGI